MSELARIGSILSGDHLEMATRTFQRFGGYLACLSCDAQQPLDGPKLAEYVMGAWPRCCGVAMEWVPGPHIARSAPGEPIPPLRTEHRTARVLDIAPSRRDRQLPTGDA